MIKVDLKSEFQNNLCSFDLAKEAKKAGMTCANTFFAYEEDGSICDGGWIESLGYDGYYPAINLSFALFMLDEVPAKMYDIVKTDDEDRPYKVTFTRADSSVNYFEAAKLVDAVLLVWLKSKETARG